MLTNTGEAKHASTTGAIMVSHIHVFNLRVADLPAQYLFDVFGAYAELGSNFSDGIVHKGIEAYALVIVWIYFAPKVCHNPSIYLLHAQQDWVPLVRVAVLFPQSGHCKGKYFFLYSLVASILSLLLSSIICSSSSVNSIIPYRTLSVSSNLC